MIVDEFLDYDELKIMKKIILDKKWNYNHTSGTNELITNKFFANYELNSFFSMHILEKINNYFNKKYKLNRNYMHIQNFAVDGSYHIDDEGHDKFTFCLYLTNIKDKNFENIGGDLFIKIPDNKHIISIEPINNRGILFQSEYLHKGMAYNRNSTENKRLCITWKLEEIK